MGECSLEKRRAPGTFAKSPSFSNGSLFFPFLSTICFLQSGSLPLLPLTRFQFLLPYGHKPLARPVDKCVHNSVHIDVCNLHNLASRRVSTAYAQGCHQVDPTPRYAPSMAFSDLSTGSQRLIIIIVYVCIATAVYQPALHSNLVFIIVRPTTAFG